MDGRKHYYRKQFVAKRVTDSNTWYIFGIKTLGGIQFEKKDYMRGNTGRYDNLSIVVGDIECKTTFEKVFKYGNENDGKIYLPKRHYVVISHKSGDQYCVEYI